jgi:DNA-binding CsgD family transcriptional regulator
MQDDRAFPACELSDKQREVLDLVVARKSSKEIARILGISKPTVDQRILAARQKYGAANRNELVASYLAGPNSYDRISYDPVYLPTDPEPGNSLSRNENSGPVFSVADVAGYIPSYAAAEFSPLPRPLETLDRKFGVFGRLGAVGLLAALIATSLVAMLSMAETLTQLL